MILDGGTARLDTWQRTLIVTAMGQVCSQLGFSFVIPFLPLYVQHLGIHGVGPVTFWSGLLAAGSAIVMAVASPVWGSLADRHGRKIMVVRAGFCAAAIIGLMGFAANVYQLLALRVLQGGLSGTIAASQALVSAQTPRERLGFALGVMQTAVYGGTFLGPLLGGLVADTFGFRAAFVVAACLLAAGATLVTILVREEPRFSREHNVSRKESNVSGPNSSLIGGMRAALQAPMLPIMILVVFATQFGVTIVAPVLPQFVQILQGRAGNAATVTGIILAGSGAAGAISSLLLGGVGDRVGYKVILVVGAGGAAILSFPQYIVQSSLELLVLRIGIGACLGALLPATSAILAGLVDPKRRGTVYGLSGSASSIGFGAGPMASAAVVAIFGIRASFLAAAVLLGAIALGISRMSLGSPARPIDAAGDGALRRDEVEPARLRRAGRG